MGDTPIRGSCLCGGVRFEVSGRPLTMAYCHCSRCRKSGGVASVLVRAGDFRWVQGEELLAAYTPEPPWKLVRRFCGTCGTYMAEAQSDPRFVVTSSEAYDDDPGLRPVLHEHVGSKAAWYEITDGLPEYDGSPPISAFFPDGPKS